MRKVAIRVVPLMAALLIVPATASAVTVRLGPPTLQTSNTAVFCPTDDCSYAFGSVTAPGGVLASPADGTVTAWRLEGDIPSSSSLIVVHPDGTQWTSVQKSSPATAGDGTAMATSLPIQAGDRIGITQKGSPGIAGIDLVTGSGIRLQFKPPLSATPSSPANTFSTGEMQFNADVTLATPTITSLTPSAGPLRGGATVTIAGQGLGGATAVKFGTAPATIVSNTSTAITVTPPDQPPGPVDVTVTTAGGTTTPTGASRYRYFEKPVVTDVTPATGPTAGGTQVTLRGSGFTGATAVRFGDTAGRIVSVAATKLVAVSPRHDAGAVDVTVTNPGVTSDTSVADGFTYSDASSSTPAPGPGPGPGSPSGPPASPGGPQLTGLSIAPHTLGRGTTARITYRLDRAATVRFALQRRARCRRAARSAKRHVRTRPCLRRVRGGFSAAGKAGANAQTFTGRLRGRRLAAGSYVLSARATDGAGRISARRTTSLRIRR